MAPSIDLLDAIDQIVYYIDYDQLKVFGEILIPSCGNDWTWYSYSKDIYFIESDLYDDEKVASEVLLGHIIKIKNEHYLNDRIVPLHVLQRENELLDIVSQNFSHNQSNEELDCLIG
jgi:hypothetical protein